MAITTTPIYGFTYPDDAEPIGDVHLHVKTIAEQAEAALQSGGVATPEAQDLLTEIGARQAADNALDARLDVIETPPTVTHPTLTASFAAFNTPPFTEGLGLAVWKDRFGRVFLEGLIKPAQALTTAETLVCTLPVGYRPAAGVRLARRVFVGGNSGTSPTAHMLQIDGDTGSVWLRLAAGIAAGNTTIQFDVSFRTSNV